MCFSCVIKLFCLCSVKFRTEYYIFFALSIFQTIKHSLQLYQAKTNPNTKHYTNFTVQWSKSEKITNCLPKFFFREVFIGYCSFHTRSIANNELTFFLYSVPIMILRTYAIWQGGMGAGRHCRMYIS